MGLTSQLFSISVLQSRHFPVGQTAILGVVMPGNRGDNSPTGKVLLQGHLGHVVLVIRGDLCRCGAVVSHISVSEHNHEKMTASGPTEPQTHQKVKSDQKSFKETSGSWTTERPPTSGS